MKDSQTQMTGRSQAVAGLWTARKTRDAQLTRIAQKHLELTTLETRHMDGLDFAEQSVSAIKEALEAAFAAGAKAAGRPAPTEPVGEVVEAAPAARKLAIATKAAALTLAELADAARDTYSEEAAPGAMLRELDCIRFAARQAAERAHFKPFAVGTDGLAFAALRNAATCILADWMGGDAEMPNAKESKAALLTISAALGEAKEAMR